MTYLTPFILFALGVLIWRQQLSGKRRFEVAEHVLAAFYKASDGLSTLRSPMIWGGEIEAANAKKDEAKAGEAANDEPPRAKSDLEQRLDRRLELRNVYAARADSSAPAFTELRTAQILADIYLGRAAYDAIDVLFKSRQQVFAAVAGSRGDITEDYFPNEELRQQHRQFEISMNRLIAEHREADGTPAETDEISRRVDAARAALEAICRPFLADPRWLTTLRGFWEPTRPS